MKKILFILFFLILVGCNNNTSEKLTPEQVKNYVLNYLDYGNSYYVKTMNLSENGHFWTVHVSNKKDVNEEIVVEVDSNKEFVYDVIFYE